MPIFSGRCYSNNKLLGKTAIVTGCNTGIGKETVLDFYKRGAKVIMACRNIDKAEAAKADIDQRCNNLPEKGKLVVEKCDLSSLKSVREFSKKVIETEPYINILVNNAGVLMKQSKDVTEDGFEMQFGTNHLGHYLSTLLLLPCIRKGAPARIVTVSSMAHAKYEINFDDLNVKNREYRLLEAYSQSKLANVLFSRELAARLKAHNIEGVNTYSLHPGMILTEIGRHFDNRFINVAKIFGIFIYPFLKTPELGAQTTIYCAVDDKCANETGLYYSDCAVKTPDRKALNDESAKKLWEKSAELVKLGDYNPFAPLDSTDNK